MGQYRQWLHYHEIDQQLLEEHTMLERALAQLQEQVHEIENDAALATSTNNMIFQALSTQFQRTQQRSDTEQPQHEPTKQSIQPALNKAENHFPIDTSTGTLTNNNPTHAPSTTGRREQTDPQLKVPRWLRNMRNTTTDQSETDPVDQQSQRTNRLVERWFERWKDTTLMKDAQQNHTENSRQEDQP